MADGSFGIQQHIVVDTNTPPDDVPTAVVAADLDGDGHADIAFTEPKRGAVGVLVGNGDGTFVSPPVEYAASDDSRSLWFAATSTVITPRSAIRGWTWSRSTRPTPGPLSCSVKSTHPPRHSASVR